MDISKTDVQLKKNKITLLCPSGKPISIITIADEREKEDLISILSQLLEIYAVMLSIHFEGILCRFVLPLVIINQFSAQ